MGLTLGVLAALLVLLPGIAFAFGLTKIHNSAKPTPKPFDQYFSPILLIVLVAALVLHGAWISVWNLFAPATHLLVDAGQALPALAGDMKSPSAESLMRSVSNYPVRIGIYFLSLAVIGSMLGKVSNRLLRERHGATWFSLLRPAEGADFIWLTADLKLDSECYLIAGAVEEFNVSTEGKLERVVLRGAARRPLHIDLAGRQKAGTVDGWTEIPGEYIIVQMEHARTINVDYFYIGDEEAGPVAAASDDATD